MKNTDPKANDKASKQVNFLHVAHYALIRLPLLIRDKICEECDWSIPTYYRKVRMDAQASNAEMEKIQQLISDELLFWQLKLAGMAKKDGEAE